MTVAELIDMLMTANPLAKVWSNDVYDGRGCFQVHGMEYDDDSIMLTNEKDED